MKLRKCWLSASLSAALLASLVAHVQASAETSGKVNVSGPDSKVDLPLFQGGDKKTEKHQFGAEVSRLLQILAKSVYSDRKAVVRELLSNAVDAIEKQHTLQLAGASAGAQLDDIDNYKVVVEVDKENGTLSFTDNGVGMTREELKSFLGTIAKSGTAEFSAPGGSSKSDKDPTNLIGQFGVGFYSVLLVAEDVAVISKNDRDPKQWIWETGKEASFHIFEDPTGPTLGRGTKVVLKLKSDASEYLDHENLEKIMKEFFSYDRHRIYLVKPKTVTEEVAVEEDPSEKKSEESQNNDKGVEVEEESKGKDEKPKTKKIEKTVFEEALISQNVKPIWVRNPSEVKPEEYESLYKTISGDKYGKPIAYTHFVGETAKSESFRVVLFIPERPPFSPFNQQEQKLDVKLHVRGVFVTAKFDDFIPKFLSFVKGIIDSDDLSLNISREIIQNSAELRGIKKKITKKIIDMMMELAADKEKYKKFYDSYSAFIKMDISEREEHRPLLSKLLRYKTSKSGSDIRSLDEYIEAMPESQKSKKVLYYLAGQMDEVEKSPFLGRFTEKGYEVLLMTEPVDEHTIQRLEKYEDHKFENIAKEGIKLDEADDKEITEFDKTYETAKKWISKALKDRVEKVVFVSGPASLPGSLKSSQFGWTGNMERLIMAQSSVKEDPMLSFFAKQKKILELNPKNPLIHEILERANSGKATKDLKATLRTLTDAMMIWSGYSVRDSSSFAKGIERLTRQVLDLPVEPLESEPEEKDEKDGKKDSDAEDMSISSLASEDKDEGEELKPNKADSDKKPESKSSEPKKTIDTPDKDSKDIKEPKRASVEEEEDLAAEKDEL